MRAQLLVRLILATALVTLSQLSGQGMAAPPPGSWPHWRGPRADGSAEGNPPIKWDGTTNVRWKTPLPGRGSSTPVVWGNRVFVTAAEDTGREADPADVPRPDPRRDTKTKPPTTWHRFLLLCLDRDTGKELWRRVASERVPHEGHHPTHSYAAGSPTTDGKRVVASFGSFGVFCYDLEGKLLWQRDFGRMLTRLGWGEASTPVLAPAPTGAPAGDRVVLNWDQETGSFLAALDASTGKTLWKVERPEVTSWATPLVATHGSTTQVVVPGTGKARGYDLATGKVLWECAGFTVNCIPSPVRHADRAIVMSGYRGAMARAIPLDSRGDVTEKAAWSHTRATPYVPSPLLVGDRLYFTAVNDAFLTCLDARTGKVLLDRARLPLRALYASPVAASGRIYLPDRDGTTAVLEHGEKLEVLSVNKLGEPIDGSPVVSGKLLLLRGERHLYCVGE